MTGKRVNPPAAAAAAIVLPDAVAIKKDSMSKGPVVI